VAFKAGAVGDGGTVTHASAGLELDFVFVSALLVN